MEAKKIETQSATIEEVYLIRVQTPVNDTSRVIEAVTNVTSLEYGNYDQVAFSCAAGTQQYRSLNGSRTGEGKLVHVSCEETSFTVTKNEETITRVIEALFESHPYEEPVILIQEVMRTRARNGQQNR